MAMRADSEASSVPLESREKWPISGRFPSWTCFRLQKNSWLTNSNDSASQAIERVNSATGSINAARRTSKK